MQTFRLSADCLGLSLFLGQVGLKRNPGFETEYNNGLSFLRFAETLSLYQLRGIGVAPSCCQRTGSHYTTGTNHQFVPEKHQKGLYQIAALA